MSDNNRNRGNLSRSFVTGAIALAFLAIGYQTALFIHRASALKIMSSEMSPDTVFVECSGDAMASDAKTNAAGGSYLIGKDKVNQNTTAKCAERGVIGRDAAGLSNGNGAGGVSGKSYPSSEKVYGRVVDRSKSQYGKVRAQLKETFAERTCESFAFNPNTVSVEDLCRLGFTLKQAESIDNYRSKGGKFRRKDDFAKSYVVADSVYRRLEPYINIPLLDINVADSAAFDELPGIGGYFASKMVSYREKLGGYSYPGQLMDIYHLDEDKYQKFSDLITVGVKSRPFRLWSLPADSLRLHPYIGNWQTAKAIELYRKNNPRTKWTVKGLEDAGILDNAVAAKLAGCRIEQAAVD